MNNFLPKNTELQNGKYRIVRFISSGGFGCTYEGYHVMMDERVAIKEFFVKDFCNRDADGTTVSVGINNKKDLVRKLRSKFVDEARAVRKLKHANIVDVYDVFDENGTSYFVMDYIDGPSLNELVKRCGALSQHRAIRYITQVAEALEYVHGKNRLHLDVKPGNIMLAPDNRAVLIDFGASKQYDEEGGENTSTLMGKTPGYAPIEQMGNNVVKFHPATDIYSLGATMYKLLTGETPPAANLIAAGEKLSPLPDHIYPSVREAVENAMHLSRDERPQTVREFIEMMWRDVPELEDIEEEVTPEDESTQLGEKGGDEVNVIEVSHPTGQGDKGEETPQVEEEDQNRTITGPYSEPKPEPKKPEEKKPEEKKPESKKPEQKKPEPQLPPQKSDEKKKEVVEEKPAQRSGWKKIIYIAGGVAVAIGIGVVAALVLLPGNDTPAPEPTPEPEEQINMAKDMKVDLENGNSFTYTGPVNTEGRPDGKGVGVYSDGRYEGEYVNGKHNGKGTFVFNDKSSFVDCTFKDGKCVEGRFNFSDGTYFIGKFNSNEQPYDGQFYTKEGTPDGKMVNGVEVAG